MREGKLFWLLAAVGLLVVEYQFIDHGVHPRAAIIILFVAIPFGFGVAWLKKKLGLIK